MYIYVCVCVCEIKVISFEAYLLLGKKAFIANHVNYEFQVAMRFIT